VLSYPAPTLRTKKNKTQREHKYFVLTSKEAYDAKVKFAQDKKTREKQIAERKRERETKRLEKEAAQSVKCQNQRAKKAKKNIQNTKTLLRSEVANLDGLTIASVVGLDGDDRPRSNNNDADTVVIAETNGKPKKDNSPSVMGDKSTTPQKIRSDMVQPTSTNQFDSGPVLYSDTETYIAFSVGDYVVVDFEGDLYPGQVISKHDGGAKIRVLHRCGINWKWPKVVDELVYSMSQIKKKIGSPLLAKRGIFIIPELA